MIFPKTLKLSPGYQFNKWKFLFLSFSIFIISFTNLYSQTTQDFDELIVDLKVSQIGVYEVPIAIKDQKAYVSIVEFFRLLKIKNEQKDGTIGGYIIKQDSTFLIDLVSKEIIYKGQSHSITQEDLITTPTTVYLKSKYFGEIFGLALNFNIRRLDLVLETKLELPFVREKRINEMRENLANVKGVVLPDTLIKRSYPFLNGGNLDWAISTNQVSDGEDDNRFNIGLGTIIAGGETNVLLNYSTKVPFVSRNQFYQWKLVNNDSKLVKQITAGKIFTRATSSLFAPVVGIQLTNSPITNRRSFGSYTLSDITEPRWTVELYVNNVLIDYTEADASGFYSFEVPIMYGTTAVNLRFYGPWGEERTEERVINIPYNFIPEKEFEYTISAGIVEDEFNSQFSRINLNYGLSKYWTLGGGVEYFSKVTDDEIMPFINSSFKLAPNLLLTGEYAFGVKAEGLLSYRTPSNLQIDLNYINYEEGQTAINYNYLEERKITVSLPIQSSLFSAYTRLSLNQIILPTSEFTTAQLLMSGSLFGVSTNLTTYGLYNNRTKSPNIYSTVSQNYRLPHRILFSPQIQFDYSTSNFTNLNIDFEKPLFRNGFINLGYENNLIRKSHTLEIGLRYSFGFAQTAATSRIGNQFSSFIQTARGSFLYDSENVYLKSTNRSSVGKGAITVQAFLDLNANEIWDPMEPAVPEIKLQNTGGRITYNKEKTKVRIFDLQPYTKFIVEIDPISLDNLAWKISKPKIAVEIIPNQFKTINIPVTIMGEVAGMVYKDGKGIGRVLINIFSSNDNLVAQVMSEGDGYFSYLGLAPGNYKAIIDPAQLNTLEFIATPKELIFSIEESEFGDIKDNLEFVLEKESN